MNLISGIVASVPFTSTPATSILQIPFASNLNATVGSATSNGTGPNVSSGVLIESATNNVVAYPTITDTNWLETGTITNDYEDTPAGNQGALVVNGASANTGAALVDAYTFTANSQKLLLSLTVKNVDTLAWQINLINQTDYRTNISYRVTYDTSPSTGDPDSYPLTISQDTTWTMAGSSMDGYYIEPLGDEWYRYWFYATAGSAVNTMAHNIQIAADKVNNNGGSIIVGEVMLEIAETSRSLFAPAGARSADSLYYTSHGLQTNDMSGTVTTDLNVVMENNSERWLWYAGSNSSANGYGVLMKDVSGTQSIEFRDVDNTDSVSWELQLRENENYGYLMQTYNIGWRKSSSSGMALYINGAAVDTDATATDNLSSPTNLYIGSDGTTESNCTFRNFNVYNEG